MVSIFFFANKNQKFFFLDPTMAHVARWQLVAEQKYKYLRESYEEMVKMRVTVPNLEKTSLKMAKAQMTIYAGIYNRDYAQYKKGVEKFETYALRSTLLKDTVARRVMEDRTEEGKAAMGNNEWMNHKLAYYKNLYNELPRRYFK